MATIFSRIISGELPADIVHRDEHVTAFRDINPVAPTHILIVPNKEIPTANELGEEDAALAGHMLLTARRLAKAICRVTEDPRILARVGRLGERLRAEDGIGNAVKIVKRVLENRPGRRGAARY